MKKLFWRVLDVIGIVTEGDRTAWKAAKRARQLRRAKKVAIDMHRENNRKYYVIASSVGLPFTRIGSYYILSTSDIRAGKKHGVFHKHMTIDWLYEHADYQTP